MKLALLGLSPIGFPVTANGARAGGGIARNILLSAIALKVALI